MKIQHPTKSLLQDYWMSYMHEIQYLAKSLLQDYKILYNENTISCQEPFTGLQDIIYEKITKKFFSTPHIIQKIF